MMDPTTIANDSLKPSRRSKWTFVMSSSSGNAHAHVGSSEWPITPSEREETRQVTTQAPLLPLGRQPSCCMHLPLSARRPTSLVEPCAVLCHLRALGRGRIPLTCRRLGAFGRGAPPALDAVIRVVCHLEIRRAMDGIFERKRPRGAVAARIREFARRKL